MSLYLVTGGAGFIGRSVCRELLSQGHDVRVLDVLVEQVHAESRAPLPDGATFIEGDVRDGAALDRALTDVDGVIHLAAEVGVGQSMYEIARYVGANDLGTAVLLEHMVAHKVRRLVVASSMSVYGEGRYVDANGTLVPARRQRVEAGHWDPVDADGAPLRPVPTDEGKTPDLASIYALTKYVQECSALIIGKAYGIDTIALRLFNVFGPGQALGNPYTGVLANFGARLLNRQRPLVFEDGLQQRDFVHVEDVARAFRLAIESAAGANGSVLNIGSGRAYTILEVARLLAEAMNAPELSPTVVGKARAGDVRHCFADISLARSLIGFEPTRSLEDAVGELAEWIRSTTATDRGEDAKRQLETRGLVA